MIEKDGKMYIFCKSHGEQAWGGHIVCLICGRLYQTKDNSEPNFVNSKCECGNQILPMTLEEKEDECFFGRAICPTCYEQNEPRINSHNKIMGDQSLIPEDSKTAFSSLISGMFNNFVLIPCLVNGEKSSAIVSYHEEEDGVYMTPHFVALNDKMMFTDIDGNSPGEDPDKKNIH